MGNPREPEQNRGSSSRNEQVRMKYHKTQWGAQEENQGERWQRYREKATDEGHTVFHSGRENKHEYRVGFLLHKNIVTINDGISSHFQQDLHYTTEGVTLQHRSCESICLDYDSIQVENFYNHPQEVVDQTPGLETGMQKSKRYDQRSETRTGVTLQP